MSEDSIYDVKNKFKSHDDRRVVGKTRSVLYKFKKWIQKDFPQIFLMVTIFNFDDTPPTVTDGDRKWGFVGPPLPRSRDFWMIP